MSNMFPYIFVRATSRSNRLKTYSVFRFTFEIRVDTRSFFACLLASNMKQAKISDAWLNGIRSDRLADRIVLDLVQHRFAQADDSRAEATWRWYFCYSNNTRIRESESENRNGSQNETKCFVYIICLIERQRESERS